MCPQQRTKRHDNVPQCLDTLGTPRTSKCGFCIKFGRDGVQNYIIPNTSRPFHNYLGRINGNQIPFMPVKPAKRIKLYLFDTYIFTVN